MNNKEQIIIDGVDVSRCVHLVDKEACGSMECQSVECGKNLNCLFKQLARKTQECELLSENLAIKEEEARHYLGEAYKYRKALEGIEKIVGECPAFDYNAKQIFDIINKTKGEE